MPPAYTKGALKCEETSSKWSPTRSPNHQRVAFMGKSGLAEPIHLQWQPYVMHSINVINLESV